MVDGTAGGTTFTSIVCCDPANSVRLAWLTAVQGAVRPAGRIVYDAVSSPRLCTVRVKVSVSPGASEPSWPENQA